MQFLENFSPELTIASPGRINFIGEHTDYNMGYVLPTAIGNKITFKFQRNGYDTQCNVYSIGYKGFSLDLKTISISDTEWENYVLGVLNEISKLTDKVKGFNCTIDSDLPLGSGLSSSAAMECGLAYGLNELFDLGLSKTTIVELSQRAEHSYVGTQCGIMDQFASVMSKEGNVILLNFWASYDQVSRESNNLLKTVYDQYHAKGFEVYSVSMDNNMTAWRDAIRFEEYTWIDVCELTYPESYAGSVYNITAIPTSFLIDKEGNIVAKNLNCKVLSTWLDNLL